MTTVSDLFTPEYGHSLSSIALQLSADSDAVNFVGRAAFAQWRHYSGQTDCRVAPAAAGS